MGWVSPTGHNDPDTKWTNEICAYDEDIYSQAGTINPVGGSDTWGSFLELTHAAITCDKVRLSLNWNNFTPDYVDIDVYRDGGWVHVYQGVWTFGWNFYEKSFTSGSVTKLRVRASGDDAYPLQQTQLRVNEADFWEAIEAPTVTTQAVSDIGLD